MTMPRANVVISDERDGFTSWLRAEFAASNAIIDSLCHHLRAVGEPGEYDLVIGCVQQRRGAWNPVLHMQQYFPITEVMLALQQVSWRRQQRHVDQVKVAGKEFKRSAVHRSGTRQGQRAQTTKENVDSQNLNANASIKGNAEKKGTVKEKEEAKLGNNTRKSCDKVLADAPNDASLKAQVDSFLKTSWNSVETLPEDAKDENGLDSKENFDLPVEKNGDAIQDQMTKDLTISPKTFNAIETIDGKMVNVAEGLNLFDKLLDEAEISKLVSLVNDLRVAGKQGQLQGPTFVVSKRPYRGHGREMIQLGVSILDAPPDEDPASVTSKDRRVEPIPGLLQGIIDRLVNLQLMPLKPDSCIIDIFNEGDHSQPHSFPHWFARPLCLLSLNDCEMIFGGVIAAERHGIYRGALKLKLAPGSLLVMQGNSTDYAKRAIPSIRKQRILVTFMNSQPSKAFKGDGQHIHSQATQASNWGTSPSRSKSHIRPKHYTPISTTGDLQAPLIQAQLSPLNSIPPLFVSPPVPTVMAFPTAMPLLPAPAGWPSPAPRHSPPRFLVPGTGVFLPPPGSDSSPPPQELSAMAHSETVSEAEIEHNPGKVNAKKSFLEGSLDEIPKQQEYNGSMDGTGNGRMIAEDDEERSVDSEMDIKTAGTT